MIPGATLKAKLPKLLPALILLSLGMAGCDTQQTRPDQARTPDLLEIRDLAEAAYDNKDWAVSEKHYTLLAQRVPAEVDPWFRLGNIYAHTNRPDAAVTAYRETLIRNPEHTRAWNNLGVLYLRQAAHSFNEMHIYLNESDPSYRQGQVTYNSIMAILGGGRDEVDSDAVDATGAAAGADAGAEAGAKAGAETGVDAGVDAGAKAGAKADVDAGAEADAEAGINDGSPGQGEQ